MMIHDKLGNLHAHKMFRTSAEAKSEGLDPVKHVSVPHLSITDRSKAVLLLKFLQVSCYLNVVVPRCCNVVMSVCIRSSAMWSPE